MAGSNWDKDIHRGAEAEEYEQYRPQLDTMSNIESKIWGGLRGLQTNGHVNFSSLVAGEIFHDLAFRLVGIWVSILEEKRMPFVEENLELDGTSQQVNTILQCRGRAEENSRSSPPQTIRSGGIQFNVVLEFAGNPPSTMAEALIFLLLALADVAGIKPRDIPRMPIFD